MAFWTYTRNRNAQDTFMSVRVQLDGGSTIDLEMGRDYDLTTTEAARARQFVELEPGRAPLNFDPTSPGLEYPPYVPAPAAGPARETESFYQPPPLAVGQGVNPFSPVSARTIVGVKGVASAILSGTITFDVNKNGTTIFSSSPSIPAGQKHGPVSAPTVTSLGVDDELTVEIESFDNADAGKSLLVVVELAPA